MTIGITIRLGDDLEVKVDSYRHGVKARTGKMITYQTAVMQLLEKALAGIEPEEAVTYTDLIARVKRLEAEVFA